MKRLQRYLIPALLGLFTLPVQDAGAAEAPVPTYLPNSHGKSLTTPVAWGASHNVIFLGAGGTTPSPYTNGSDGAAVLGVGLGDPVKNIGVQLSVTSIDISAWGEYSASVQVSRDLGNSNAIAVGLQNLMITTGGDTGKSYYVVYSQGAQSDPFVNQATGDSKLTYSIGVGSGIFGKKSPADILDGKGTYGTYVFGNLAYEVAQSFNLITDWNGLNLNAGVSKTFFLSNVPLGIVLGVADLTHYSGDGPRLIVSVGTGFPF
jgi:hypothetical protein